MIKLAKKRLNCFIVNIAIYHIDIVVIVGKKGIQEFYQYAKDKEDIITKEFIESLNSMSQCAALGLEAFCQEIKVFESNNLMSYVIFLDIDDNTITARQISAISHESLHITMMILNTIGIVYDSSNQATNESFTYLQAFLFEEILYGLTTNKQQLK
jgi:hypothetical protein